MSASVSSDWFLPPLVPIDRLGRGGHLLYTARWPPPIHTLQSLSCVSLPGDSSTICMFATQVWKLWKCNFSWPTAHLHLQKKTHYFKVGGEISLCHRSSLYATGVMGVFVWNIESLSAPLLHSLPVGLALITVWSFLEINTEPYEPNILFKKAFESSKVQLKITLVNNNCRLH